MSDRALAIVLNAVLTSVPRVVTATTQIAAIKPTRHSVFNQSRALVIVAEPIDYATDGRDPFLSVELTRFGGHPFT
jgi:hypothetical protein